MKTVTDCQSSQS